VNLVRGLRYQESGVGGSLAMSTDCDKIVDWNKHTACRTRVVDAMLALRLTILAGPQGHFFRHRAPSPTLPLGLDAGPD